MSSRIPMSLTAQKRRLSTDVGAGETAAADSKRISMSGSVTPSGPGRTSKIPGAGNTGFSTMKTTRTPLSASLNNKYVDQQQQQTPMGNTNRKAFNMSGGGSTFESHMLEADLKACQVKIASLEQDLKCVQNEKQRSELELNSCKEKHANELRNLEDQKRSFEISLKNSKTNENLLKGELDNLRNQIEDLEQKKLAEKDREIRRLNDQLAELSESSRNVTGESEKKLIELNYELETKSNQIDQLEDEVRSLNENVKQLEDYKEKFEQIRMENSRLQNRIKDLELETQTMKDEAQHFKNYVNDSAKIEQLERDNRKLLSECEYFKATQEKIHLIQEELRSKTESLSRLEKIIVKVQMENAQLQEEVRNSETNSNNNQTYAPGGGGEATTYQTQSIGDDTRIYIRDLEDEITNHREKMKSLAIELKQTKATLSEKEKSIDDLQKSLVRLNAERNGYKKIIDQYDSERSGSADEDNKLLYKRIDEMEYILSEYKKFISEPIELKLCNNSTFRIEDQSNKKSVETQVNLNAEIYKSYDAKIAELKLTVNQLMSEKGEHDAQRLAELNMLLNENRELKEKLRDLDQDRPTTTSKSAAASVTSSEEDNRTESEIIKELEKKVEHEEVMRQRLMTEFERNMKKIIRTFKHLFGFKFEFDGQNQVKLSSIFNEDHFLLFRINSDYTLSLLESEYANYFQNYLDFYLKENHSIPSFLSAIILDTKGFKVDMSM